MSILGRVIMLGSEKERCTYSRWNDECEDWYKVY